MDNIIVIGYEPFSKAIANYLMHRFTLVKEVAKIKYIRGMVVVDNAREERLITKVVKEAQLLHLPVPLILELMQAQIDMSKHYQHWLISGWESGLIILPNSVSNTDLSNLRLKLEDNDISLLEYIHDARASYGRDLAMSLILDLHFSHPSIESDKMKRFKVALYRALLER